MRLNQVLAIESDLKKRVYSELTELDKATRKAELLNGFISTYEPLAEDGGGRRAHPRRVLAEGRPPNTLLGETRARHVLAVD